MKAQVVSPMLGAATQNLEEIMLQHKDEHSGLYQETVFIRLTKPTTADYLQLDASQTNLNIEFKTLDYNALHHASSALKAKTSVRKNKVIIEFPAPVHLTAIELLKSKGASASYHILIYRVDGDAIAKQASARATSGIKTNYRSQTCRYQCNIKGKVFALALNDIYKNPLPFNEQWLSGLFISSKPNSPRVALLAPEFDEASQQLTLDKGTPSLIHLQAGELGNEEGDTANPGMISLQQAFSEIMQSALQRLQPILKQQVNPPSIDFKLMISSGAPCMIRLSDLSIVYSNIKHILLDNQSEKVSLKFNGDLQQVQTLSLSIPETSMIDEAVLAIDQSFNNNANAVDSSMLLTQAIHVDQGIAANPEERLCQCFKLETAYQLQAIWVAVSSLKADTRFSLSIVKDLNGRPDGDTVIRFPDTVLDTQVAQWVTFNSSETTLLNSGTYWIVSDTHQGQLIWHINEQINQFIQHTNQQGISHQFQHLQGLYVLAKDNKRVPEKADADNHQSLLIKIDNTLLMPMDRDDDTLSNMPKSMFHYDMRTALMGKKGQVTLRFFSSQRGMITVYPPLLVYD